jgi:G6PDH family F420-dependent oxidoreductase
MKHSGLGYVASFEQFHPTDMLRWSQQAEQAGFVAVAASDHFHPWTPQQGQSAFVWSWMGAVGAATGLRFGTAVTPPGWRYHPAVLAQAAATLEAMFPGRFFLGLGAGEALNEHVVGEYWPEAGIRTERLFESIEIINKLFTGKVVKHTGKHFRVESAKLYTRPDVPPPIYVATSGPLNASRTGQFTDGLMTVGAADDKLQMLIGRFEDGARKAGKDPDQMPKILLIKISFAGTEAEAAEQAVREWPNGGMAFPKADIRNPEDFEAMAKLVRPEHFKNRVILTPDLDEHIRLIQHYIDLGFDEIYVHNVGRNQDEFIEAYGRHVLPALKWSAATPVAAD